MGKDRWKDTVFLLKRTVRARGGAGQLQHFLRCNDETLAGKAAHAACFTLGFPAELCKSGRTPTHSRHASVLFRDASAVRCSSLTVRVHRVLLTTGCVRRGNWFYSGATRKARNSCCDTGLREKLAMVPPSWATLPPPVPLGQTRWEGRVGHGLPSGNGPLPPRTETVPDNRADAVDVDALLDVLPQQL